MSAQFDQMRVDELPVVLDWATTEGWNPGLEDAEAFYASDPSGFFVARVDGAPVAAISVVNHSDDFAFLGLYICAPKWRGQGVGKALWDHAITHAGARTIGLDGVPDQQANYKASGFVRADETARYTGKLPTSDVRLPQARGSDLTWMIDKERAANGYAKPVFLANWLKRGAARKTYILDDQQGFATVRRCQAGAKIGPLVAKDAQSAQKLMVGSANAFPGPVSIDVPASNTALGAYCIARGMTCDFKTARMYRGAPPIPGTQHRAIATMELG